MIEEITREIFEKLVELAALELGEEEGEYIRQQLNNQLTAITELAAVPLPEGTPLAAHGVPYTPEISPKERQDRHNPFPNPAGILEIAPETEDGYIITPEIPHEDLG